MHRGEHRFSTPPVLLLGGAEGACRIRRRELQRAGFTVRWILKTLDLAQMIGELCPVLVLVNVSNARGPKRGVYGKIRDAFSAADVRLIVFGPKAPAGELVAWLECGVDDYIDEAVDAAEFLARIRAVSKGLGSVSSNFPPIISSQRVKIGGIELDTSGMRLLVRGREVRVTSLEFRLLQFLIQHREEVFTRAHLLSVLWKGDKSRALRTVDSCISRIREKIAAGNEQSIRLSAVRGIGYRLDVLPETVPFRTRLHTNAEDET